MDYVKIFDHVIKNTIYAITKDKVPNENIHIVLYIYESFGKNIFIMLFSTIPIMRSILNLHNYI